MHSQVLISALFQSQQTVFECILFHIQYMIIVYIIYIDINL